MFFIKNLIEKMIQRRKRDRESLIDEEKDRYRIRDKSKQKSNTPKIFQGLSF